MTEPICSVERCRRPVHQSGWCSRHYARWLDHLGIRPATPTSDPTLCAIADCAKPRKSGAKGWCYMHYTRWYRHGDPHIVLPKSPLPPPKRGPRKPRVPCKVDDCDRDATTRGWCTKHYHHWRANGDPVKPAPRKPRPPKTQCKYGHPLSGNNIRVHKRPTGSISRICRACERRNAKAYQARVPRADRPGPPCSIDGCTNIARARGWCPKHYVRWRKHGNPLTVHRGGQSVKRTPPTTQPS